MAQINMNGKQSFLLNDIKQHIRNGGNVSHILNVKVSNQRSAEEGNRIREQIFRTVCRNPITKIINGVHVTITWRSSATNTSAYYHTDVGGMFGDTAVKLHSQALLRDLLQELDPQFNNVFANGTTGVAFLVTKPLVREVVLGDDEM